MPSCLLELLSVSVFLILADIFEHLLYTMHGSGDDIRHSPSTHGLKLDANIPSYESENTKP